MGVHDKVVLLILFVTLSQIIFVLSLPRSINKSSLTKYLTNLKSTDVCETPKSVTVPLSKLKKARGLKYRPKHALKNYIRAEPLKKIMNFPEVVYPINAKTTFKSLETDFVKNNDKSKDKTDLSPILRKLKKEFKSKFSNSLQKSSPEVLSKTTSNNEAFCFKDIGTFPEVEYPVFVSDTWAPKFWNNQPFYVNNKEVKTSNLLDSFASTLHKNADNAKPKSIPVNCQNNKKDTNLKSQIITDKYSPNKVKAGARNVSTPCSKLHSITDSVLTPMGHNKHVIEDNLPSSEHESNKILESKSNNDSLSVTENNIVQEITPSPAIDNMQKLNASQTQVSVDDDIILPPAGNVSMSNIPFSISPDIVTLLTNDALPLSESSYVSASNDLSLPFSDDPAKPSLVSTLSPEINALLPSEAFPNSVRSVVPATDSHKSSDKSDVPINDSLPLPIKMGDIVSKSSSQSVPNSSSEKSAIQASDFPPLSVSSANTVVSSADQSLNSTSNTGQSPASSVIYKIDDLPSSTSSVVPANDSLTIPANSAVPEADSLSTLISGVISTSDDHQFPIKNIVPVTDDSPSLINNFTPETDDLSFLVNNVPLTTDGIISPDSNSDISSFESNAIPQTSIRNVVPETENFSSPGSNLVPTTDVAPLSDKSIEHVTDTLPCSDCGFVAITNPVPCFDYNDVPASDALLSSESYSIPVVNDPTIISNSVPLTDPSLVDSDILTTYIPLTFDSIVDDVLPSVSSATECNNDICVEPTNDTPVAAAFTAPCTISTSDYDDTMFFQDILTMSFLESDNLKKFLDDTNSNKLPDTKLDSNEDNFQTSNESSTMSQNNNSSSSSTMSQNNNYHDSGNNDREVAIFPDTTLSNSPLIDNNLANINDDQASIYNNREVYDNLDTISSEDYGSGYYIDDTATTIVSNFFPIQTFEGNDYADYITKSPFEDNEFELYDSTNENNVVLREEQSNFQNPIEDSTDCDGNISSETIFVNIDNTDFTTESPDITNDLTNEERKTSEDEIPDENTIDDNISKEYLCYKFDNYLCKTTNDVSDLTSLPPTEISQSEFGEEKENFTYLPTEDTTPNKSCSGETESIDYEYETCTDNESTILPYYDTTVTQSFIEIPENYRSTTAQIINFSEEINSLSGFNEEQAKNEASIPKEIIENTENYMKTAPIIDSSKEIPPSSEFTEKQSTSLTPFQTENVPFSEENEYSIPIEVQDISSEDILTNDNNDGSEISQIETDPYTSPEILQDSTVPQTDNSDDNGNQYLMIPSFLSKAIESTRLQSLDVMLLNFKFD